MILQALTRYYEDLLSRGEIAAPGWAPAKISLALYINENGELTQISAGERWTYDMGKDRFMQIVTVRNGVIQDIKDGPRH